MSQTIHELHSLGEVAKAGNIIASGFKEHGAKTIDPHFDIPPYLVGFRGERGRAGAVIEVICEEVDRERGLDAMYLLAAMECVAIAATFDAHLSTQMTNPRTGKRWKQDEMQKLCDGEGACDLGLLTDCLMTSAVFADGKVAGYNRSYHLHEAKGEIAWVSEGEAMGEGVEGATLGGYVIENMKHLMKEGHARAQLVMSGLAAQEAGIVMPQHAGTYRDTSLILKLAEDAAMVRLDPMIAKTGKERAIIERAVEGCDNVFWMR